MELEKNSNRPDQEGDINPNNPNQFRRQFAPRFIPRERRNNDIQRERRPVSLLNMQEAVLEVESNIQASNRLKVNSDQQAYDRKGKKEVVSVSTASQSADNKFDEMEKIVKVLTEKLKKLELGKNSNRHVQEGDINPNNPN